MKIHCDSAGNFAAAIDKLYENRELCEFYAKNVALLIESAFSLNRSYEEYKKIVLQLIKDSK